MQLKYNKTIRKNVVIVDIETIKFTPRELLAFQSFGEPEIIIEKMYPVESQNPTFPVSIRKKIRSSFKLRIKFDGSNDMDAALEAADSFYEDIKVILEDVLYQMTDKLEDAFSYDLGTGVEIIDSGIESNIPPMQKPHHHDCPGHHVAPPRPGCIPSPGPYVVWRDGSSCVFSEPIDKSGGSVHN